MVSNGEPGLINMSNLTKNNSYYFAPVRGTNPCGETCLEDYGVCNLGSLVLPKFVSGGRTKWKELEEVTRLGIRFLDTCIDLNRYSLQPIKQTAQRGRRIGLGVMGLADMLFDLELRYGSRDAIDYIERLMKFIRNISYEESCKLAQEKGAFPAFSSDLYCKSKFIRTLPPSLRHDIRKHGTRNVTLLAIAPTGTISLIPETTSSIEPLMYKAYERRDRVSNRYYIHNIYSECINTGASLPDYFVDSTDLTPQEHVDTQIAVQKYVDGAVSKTINVPKTFKKKDLSDLLLESIDDLKGVTVYRDGSREGQIIRPITNSKTLVDANQQGNIKEQSPESVACATGSCDLD
jgi:ribonucleoside-diphosphate reductase alpha chain